MQRVLKAPVLVTTPYGKDIAFKIVSLHDDSGKRIKNLKITDELLNHINEKEIRFMAQWEQDNLFSVKQ